jgi:hypothetical protein
MVGLKGEARFAGLEAAESSCWDLGEGGRGDFRAPARLVERPFLSGTGRFDFAKAHPPSQELRLNPGRDSPVHSRSATDFCAFPAFWQVQSQLAPTIIGNLHQLHCVGKFKRNACCYRHRCWYCIDGRATEVGAC